MSTSASFAVFGASPQSRLSICAKGHCEIRYRPEIGDCPLCAMAGDRQPVRLVPRFTPVPGEDDISVPRATVALAIEGITQALAKWRMYRQFEDDETKAARQLCDTALIGLCRAIGQEQKP